MSGSRMVRRNRYQSRRFRPYELMDMPSEKGTAWLGRATNVTGHCGRRCGPARPAFAMFLVALAAMAFSGCVQFPDPGERGSLIIYDHPVMPERYRGLWANRLESCGAVGDRGMQVEVSAQMVGTANITRIEGYSDHPAIVVSTDHPDPGQDRLFLDLSIDQRWLKLSMGYNTPDVMLRRCRNAAKR